MFVFLLVTAHQLYPENGDTSPQGYIFNGLTLVQLHHSRIGEFEEAMLVGKNTLSVF